MKTLEVKVCAKCGLIEMAKNKQGKSVCPVCDCEKFITATIPEETILKCSECKTEWTLQSILKQWDTIPFFNAYQGNFYDGCHGWD